MSQLACDVATSALYRFLEDVKLANICRSLLLVGAAGGISCPPMLGRLQVGQYVW